MCDLFQSSSILTSNIDKAHLIVWYDPDSTDLVSLFIFTIYMDIVLMSNTRTLQVPFPHMTVTGATEKTVFSMPIQTLYFAVNSVVFVC